MQICATLSVSKILSKKVLNRFLLITVSFGLYLILFMSQKDASVVYFPNFNGLVVLAKAFKAEILFVLNIEK